MYFRRCIGRSPPTVPRSTRRRAPEDFKPCDGTACFLALSRVLLPCDDDPVKHFSSAGKNTSEGLCGSCIGTRRHQPRDKCIRAEIGRSTPLFRKAGRSSARGAVSPPPRPRRNGARAAITSRAHRRRCDCPSGDRERCFGRAGLILRSRPCSAPCLTRGGRRQRALGTCPAGSVLGPVAFGVEAAGTTAHPPGRVRVHVRQRASVRSATAMHALPDDPRSRTGRGGPIRRRPCCAAGPLNRGA